MSITRREFCQRTSRGLLGIGTVAITSEITGSLFGEEPAVSDAEMESIYQEVKTPYKYGIVLPQEDGDLVDSGKVYRYQGRWYMSYLRMLGEIGYVSRLAVSDDLLHWTPLGTTLPFSETGWDAWQASPSPALVDYDWGGTYEIRPYEGKYWFSYLGGAGKGYEPDPLKVGLAWTYDPSSAQPFNRIAEPILTPDDPDARSFEKLTLFQTNIMRVDAEKYGAPFYCFYNARDASRVERIGIAVSDDIIHWRRLGPGPVIDNGSGISGDPQIAKIGNLWVMFYFGAWWKPRAFDTFAVSKDLVTWRKWEGNNLTEPSEPYDQTYAHKPCVVKWNGIVYHFYCAVGDQGRCIGLATNKPIA